MAARARWAEHCNSALQRAGRAERVDHRSHQARGLEILPMTREWHGPDGVRARVRNQEIRALNYELGELKFKRDWHVRQDTHKAAEVYFSQLKRKKMEAQTAADIRQKIDTMLAALGTTLDALRVELRPLGVTMLEDYKDRFSWRIKGEIVVELQLGERYTRASLLERGLLLKEPNKKPLGFLDQTQQERPKLDDDELADALRTLLKLAELLSLGGQNILIAFLNLVLQILRVDFRIHMCQLRSSDPARAQLEGTGAGDADTKKRLLLDVNELTKKVQMVVNPAPNRARLERAREEQKKVFEEEKRARMAKVMATTPPAKREAEQKHRDLAKRRLQLEQEIQELVLQLLSTEEREVELEEYLAVEQQELVDDQRTDTRQYERPKG